MKNISFFDSHAHLSGDGVFEQVDCLLERAQAADVNSIVNICTDRVTLERGIALSQRYPWVYLAASTTPHDVDKEGEIDFPIMAEAARRGLLRAVGETGLDYFYKHSLPETQKEYLRRYLQLALECQLPVVIHCREAFSDLFDIIDSDYKVNNKYAPGVLHCFTGTLEEAEKVIERGWMLSLSGIVTFKKSLELHEVAKKVPLSHLLIETDTPYLAPQSHRGKSNEPSYIVETAAFIAQLRGISVEEIAQATQRNAKALFQIA